MVRKAIIMITLVEESTERSEEEIKKAIVEELSREPTRIPWLKTVEKVTILEE